MAEQKKNKQPDNHYMAGKLLLAMPSMGDMRFEKSVIYICAHDEQGAMGLVINNPVKDIEFHELLDQLKITSDITLDLKATNIPVMNGGPVEGARGFLLHSNDFNVDDTIKVAKDIHVTGTLDALKEVAKGNGPQEKLFILGYSGWSAGQLDQELQQNAWLIVDADPALVFHDDQSGKWDMALKKLGIDPVMLSSTGGRA